MFIPHLPWTWWLEHLTRVNADPRSGGNKISPKIEKKIQRLHKASAHIEEIIGMVGAVGGLPPKFDDVQTGTAQFIDCSRDVDSIIRGLKSWALAYVAWNVHAPDVAAYLEVMIEAEASAGEIAAYGR